MGRKLIVAVAFSSLLVFQAGAQDVNPYLEKPVCGDDQSEYLVEEMGESRNSQRYDGEYGCTPDRTECLYRGSDGSQFYDQGEYKNAEEQDEDEGRFKQDAEYCFKASDEPFASFWDQDYGDVDGDGSQESCRVNTLYGKEGIRWFPESYIEDYPEAVTGGIDDDWNERLRQKGETKKTSSVSTGTLDSGVATLGFCGGDDGSEYLVTQECETRYCETDRSVQGVASVPGSCVFRGSGSKYSTNVDQRDIFNPGEEVQVTGIGLTDNPTIACFNGAWYSDWPVHFNKDSVEVPVGETRTVSFQLINVQNTETTFDVVMEQSSDDPSADQFSSFVSSSGKSFETTVAPQSSKTIRIEITGGNIEVNDSDLTVRADAANTDLTGSDSINVDIVESSSGTTSTQTRNVPGIAMVHVFALMFAAILIYFFTTERETVKSVAGSA